MLTFWIIAALLTALALAFVVSPLLARRDAATGTPRGFPKTVLALIVLMPVLAVLGYQLVGEPRALDPELQAMAASMQEAHAQGQSPMHQAIAGLAERMAAEPDDLEGWLLLGRAYKSVEEFGNAHAAFREAARLAPDVAGVLVEYAEAQVLDSPSRRFEGEPLQQLEQALALEPDNQRGLWLRGIAYYQAGEGAAAIATWEHLLSVMPEEQEARTALAQQIDEFRRMIAADSGEPGQPVAAPADATAPARLVVQVALTEELAGRVADDDVVFVFARAAEGPRLPLAIQTLAVRDLPVTVTLDDSHAMMPEMKLSDQARVVVGARISRDGSADVRSGDLEGFSEPLSSRQQAPIELRIDTVVP